MLFEAKFRARTWQIYRHMEERAQPRLWKTGKQQGKIRVPGIYTLPFDRDALWRSVRAQIPEGGALCPYCRDYGRSTTIYLNTFEIDHHDPIRHGGSWALDNLICVCPDCNNLKGSMTYTAFIQCMRDFLPGCDPSDRTYILSCLRTHGLVLRARPKGKGAGKAPPTAKQLKLEDPF